MIEYRDFQEKDTENFIKLVKCLYEEDAECTAMTDLKISGTIRYLTTHREMGRIIMILHHGQIVGYAILINFWSNEYGGFVVHLDELYVTHEFRNKNIASEFINYLEKTSFNNAVALFLEVTPSNENAHRLYKRLGFAETGRRHMIKHLKVQF